MEWLLVQHDIAMTHPNLTCRAGVLIFHLKVKQKEKKSSRSMRRVELNSTMKWGEKEPWYNRVTRWVYNEALNWPFWTFLVRFLGLPTPSLAWTFLIVKKCSQEIIPFFGLRLSKKSAKHNFWLRALGWEMPSYDYVLPICPMKQLILTKVLF